MAGKVYLVGAGPGDPGLLTIKGKACLEQADVVLYDRLAAPELLTFAPIAAERIFVGKTAQNHAVKQAEINQLLIAKAQLGLTVVRLKGGDPFVFGRGAEEAQALVAAGIPFEVIPGVTSAIAAPAYAGIPVTHRDYSAVFHVVTGHECLTSTASDSEWQHLAVAKGTLVILMGLGHIQAIAERLISLGKPATTPVAVIQSGTTSEQVEVHGTLANIAGLVADEQLQPPATIVVGEVVQLADRLKWFQGNEVFEWQERF